MGTSALSPSEYNSYYHRYIEKASQESLFDGLNKGFQFTADFFSSIPSEKHEYRYAEGKWTPKDILLHIIDTERVFAYRALQFVRSKGAVLQGFDQDEFAKSAETTARSMEDLIAEFQAVRNATLLFTKSCSPTSLLKMGEASGSPLTARAALYIIVGHELHHCAVIQERYL